MRGGADVIAGMCAQVVIVSPLIRALETAAGAFGAGPFKGSGRPLMLAQSGEPDECAAHCAVACPEGIPFIAFEGCRERLGACRHFFGPSGAVFLSFCGSYEQSVGVC